MTANPSIVFDMATAFWRSNVLFSACKLGVFDLLNDSPATVDDISERLNASERGVFGLLESCVALGLLCKDADQYSNTETANKYLTKKSPESLLVTLNMQAATYPMWMKLADSVVTGKPAMPPGNMLGDNSELTRSFVLGMHQRAIGVAQCLVDEVDLSGRHKLADIGGGPGTFSVMMVKKNSSLNAQVMDLAPIIAIARELIDEAGVGDRIETIACDVCKDDFGSGFDVALISGLLHRMTKDDCLSIFRKVYNSLPANGLIVVNDLFSTGTGPEMAVLFGLQMLLTCETGRTHSVDQISEWLKEAGFCDLQTKTLRPPLPYTILTARK